MNQLRRLSFFGTVLYIFRYPQVNLKNYAPVKITVGGGAGRNTVSCRMTHYSSLCKWEVLLYTMN